MKKFIKSETYIDKNGNTYSYDGKYRGYWQFFKHSDKNGLNGGLKTFNERQLLELELYLK